MTEEIGKTLASLADRFCERRAYRCLLRFMPAYFSITGLTDGWDDCRNNLKDTRSLCRDDLKPDELADINKVINLIDRMLDQRDTLVGIQNAIIDQVNRQ